MSRSFALRTVAFAAILGAFSTAALAQVVVQESKPPPGGPTWYRFGGSTGGVPGGPAPAQPGLDIRKLQGQPYGDAVAKLPDWNGVWVVKDELAVGVFDPATADGVHDDKEGADFGVVAGGREHPPYTAEYEKIYSERVRRARDEGFNDDYVSFCRPQGFPRWYANPGAWDMVVTPKVIWWVMSEQGNIRRIYMDGRKFLEPEVGYPQDQGTSLGHWEGDTLVVETRNMMAGNYDQSGAPYSDNLHVVERIHMLPSGELQVDLTLTDPGVLTRPWKVTRILRRNPMPPGTSSVKAPGADYATLVGNYCSGNRNVRDASGNQSVLLPGEAAPGSQK